jgi:hypothetical protein
MLKKIFDFLLVFVLIIKLLLNLASFTAQYLIIKTKKRKELTILLLIVFLMLSLINWQLWQKRKDPQVELKIAQSQNQGEILFTLEKEELDQLKNFYLTLESKQKYSRDVLFNLGKILELEDPSLAQEKFQQAHELDPNYSPQ